MPRAISALAAAVVLTTLVTPTTEAHSWPGTYVAIGDSYAAGSGIPVQAAGLCMRSDHSYGHLVATALAFTSQRDVTCAGAKVEALARTQTDAGIPVNGPQLDAISQDTTLVTLTIGGNNLGTSDLGFVDVVAACTVLALTNPQGAPCRDFYRNTLTRRLDAAAKDLSKALQRIRVTASRAKVLVVGYPSVLPENAKKCVGKLPTTMGDTAYLYSVLRRLNSNLVETAAANGVTYVDTATPTKGHDSCSSDPWIEGVIPMDPTIPLHPDTTGERVMAEAVLESLRGS
ncbi:SGNH/GDSL hydrolase family protein [Streptomyces luteireticuli]|uniref:SGNH/GDSL hydrolase family protein n=1 Tax=Streptomyces luteireticuli TaxID=173858 RepID=UPI003559080C